MIKFLTKLGQKHDYQTLEYAFSVQSIEEIKSILNHLGLGHLVGNEGTAAMYGIDVVSDKPNYIINNDYNIKIEGKVYNFFSEVSENVTSWSWKRNSGDTQLDTVWNANSAKTRVLQLSKSDFGSKENTKFTVTAIIDDKELTDSITFSQIMTFGKAQIIPSYTMFVDDKPSTIDLKCELFDIEPFKYSWFVNNLLKASTEKITLKNSDYSAGSIVNIKLEVTSASGQVYTDMFTIPKIKTGKDGQQGVPGPPGEDGKPRYTWLKYSNSASGENMSDSPLNADGSFKEYIGIAENRTDPTEENDPTIYKWSKYIGEDGIPGENGYIWVKYSIYENGREPITNNSSMYDTPRFEINGVMEDAVYIGMAYNKQEISEVGSVPEDYIWAKFKGEDGHTAYILDATNDMITFPADDDGNIIGQLSGNETEVFLYYGDTQQDMTNYFTKIEQTGGVTFTSTRTDSDPNNDKTIQIVVTNIQDDTGSITISLYNDAAYTKLLATDTISIFKARNSAAYNIVPSINQISVTSSGVLTPTKLSAKVVENSGYEVKDVPVGKGQLTYRYNYQSGDGIPVAINEDITINSDQNPTFIEFMYFHPTTGVLVDKETIKFVRDGQNGKDGEPGPPGQTGENGQPGPRGPFLAPRGNWNSTAQYVGNADRLEAVLYNSEWYVTLTTSGNIPIGTLPTNTTYWKKADQTFDFIATGLLLAQTAYIENLGVRSLRTSDTGQRVEILADDNSMKFYVDGKTNPAVTITSAQGGNGNDAIESPVVEVRGKVKQNENSDRTSFMSNSGVFSNGSNMYFLNASASGAENSACIVGLYQTEDAISEPVFNSYRAGVVGINQSQTNTGRTFGGMFNSAYIGSLFRPMKTIGSGTTYATIDCGMYFNPSTGGNNLYLPVMADAKTINGTWNRGIAFEIELLVGENAFTRVYSQNGANSMYGAGSTGTNIVTERAGIWRFIWTGTQWFIIRYISYWK